MHKRWSGRFSQAMDPQAAAFGASIPFDHALARYDIEASLAYSEALQQAGLLTRTEAQKIVRGLRGIARQIEAGRFRFRVELEDIHTHIEQALIAKIGPVGGKLHTGRSRNDQVATDLRLFCLDHLKQLQQGLRQLQKTLVKKAEQWSGVIIPGYTHLQRAQPVLLAHHLLAYVEMLARDEERLTQAETRTSVLPLGAGALAGNPFPIDRRALARKLGFKAVASNSLDAVSDRDFAVEIAAAATLLMVHLSRLSEELILWSSQEFGFIHLPESFCTGSSMMPQKINPDLPELIRGKTGRAVGTLMALLVMLKGLPLAYNKDLQEDKEPLFDLFATVTSSVTVLSSLLAQTEINRDAMSQAMQDETMLATDLADQLVRQKVPFRQAHEITAKIIRAAEQKGIPFTQLKKNDLARIDKRVTPALLKELTPTRSVANRKTTGGTASANVKRELARHKKRLRGRRSS